MQICVILWPWRQRPGLTVCAGGTQAKGQCNLHSPGCALLAPWSVLARNPRGYLSGPQGQRPSPQHTQTAASSSASWPCRPSLLPRFAGPARRISIIAPCRVDVHFPRMNLIWQSPAHISKLSGSGCSIALSSLRFATPIICRFH